MAKAVFGPFFAQIMGGFILLAFFSSVFATCTKSAVEKADTRWANAIDSNNVNKVVNLYAKKAVLIATVQTTPIVTRLGLEAYFEKFFRTYKNVRVSYKGNKYIQIFNGGAASSGLYTFSGIQKGKATQVKARYTFVYRSTANGCELITHHSSPWPE
ncbi:MAG: hypothetical protein K0R48_1395 [Gammaproteobacteria bacterium]|nr:hypothetical protein [Gammaproteobacteria bacterium]